MSLVEFVHGFEGPSFVMLVQTVGLRCLTVSTPSMGIDMFAIQIPSWGKSQAMGIAFLGDGFSY